MKQIIYFLLCLVLFSCGNNKKGANNTVQEKPKLSIVKEHSSVEGVKKVFNKEIDSWEELNSLNTFIKKFEKVSPNEALSNALELKDLVKSLKDSIKPKIFDIPSFNARVNVLHNESLRLADLTRIPAITATDINLQVEKTRAAFSSVNSKINTILSKKRFEDAIDVDVKFIGIDSTKMDSVSKKTIDLKKKEELLKKKQIDKKAPVRINSVKKRKS